MRVAALIVGLIGGLMALYLGYFGGAFGGLVTLGGNIGPGQLLVVFTGVGLPILSIVGAALSIAYPGVAGIVMLVGSLVMAGIAGFNFLALASVLLIFAGAVLALVAAGKSVTIDRILMGVLLIVLWQFASWKFTAYWVSTPWLTVARFVTSTFNGEMLSHAGYTIEEAFLGAVIGAVPAIILPFALRRLPSWVTVLDPFMVAGYGSPKLALAPLFILWFGIGVESKIALVASVVFFIEYFNTLSGVRSLDHKLVQMAHVMGAKERQVARHIVFPGAVPHIFAGLRISLPFGIAVAVVAELISSNRGLGYLVQIGAMNFDITQVFAAILGATLIVLGVGWIMNKTETILLRWRPPADSLIQQINK